MDITGKALFWTLNGDVTLSLSIVANRIFAIDSSHDLRVFNHDKCVADVHVPHAKHILGLTGGNFVLFSTGTSFGVILDRIVLWKQDAIAEITHMTRYFY